MSKAEKTCYNKSMIYLDHAAATPVSAKALRAMLPYYTDQFFNPSAPYLPAKHVREAYESAKDDLAHTIGAKGVDLVITAGATESINLAFTVLDQLPRSKCLALATEHAAVLETAKSYNYDLIKVDENGLINLDDFRQKLTDDIALVSISLANNELGTIQPLAEIAETLRQIRQDRLQRGITLPLYLHSDASQALSLMDINVARMGVDLLTLNAAKCGGPKGVGALYVGHSVKLRPVSLGGGQERGLRSGTENVPGVIGFACAAHESKTHLSSNRKLYQKMTDIICQELKLIKISKINSLETACEPQSTPFNRRKANSLREKTALEPEAIEAECVPYTPIIAQNNKKVNKNPGFVKILGNSKHQLASFLPICFPGIDAERLIYRLEMRGVLVSTGAACAASKGTKSHVLAAIGLSDDEIAGSIRISLGSTNTLENVRAAAKIIRKEVEHEYARVAKIQSSGTVSSSSFERLKRAKAERAEGGTRKDGLSSGSREKATIERDGSLYA